MLGTSHLGVPSFFTWNLSRTWLRSCMSWISLHAFQACLGFHSTFQSSSVKQHSLPCMPRTPCHAISSLPCAHSFHAGRRTQGALQATHGPASGGGFEGLEPREWLPENGSPVWKTSRIIWKERKNSRSRMPIKALSQLACLGFILCITLERRSDQCGLFPCTATYAIFLDDKTSPPPLPSPDLDSE